MCGRCPRFGPRRYKPDFPDFWIHSLPGKRTGLTSTEALRDGSVYAPICGGAMAGPRRQLLVMARKNSTLFTEVRVALQCPSVRRIAFIGGFDQACSGPEDIMDVYRLWARQNEDIGSRLVSPLPRFQAVSAGNAGKARAAGATPEQIAVPPPPPPPQARPPLPKIRFLSF